MKPRKRARRRLAEEVGRWIDTRQSIDTRSLPGDGNRQTYAPPLPRPLAPLQCVRGWLDADRELLAEETAC